MFSFLNSRMVMEMHVKAKHLVWILSRCSNVKNKGNCKNILQTIKTCFYSSLVFCLEKNICLGVYSLRYVKKPSNISCQFSSIRYIHFNIIYFFRKKSNNIIFIPSIFFLEAFRLSFPFVLLNVNIDVDWILQIFPFWLFVPIHLFINTSCTTKVEWRMELLAKATTLFI